MSEKRIHLRIEEERIGPGSVQVRLGVRGVTVELWNDPVDNDADCDYTMYKPYRELSVAVRDIKADVPSYTELCEMWTSGKTREAINTLERAHPCVTAIVLVAGSAERRLSAKDCNSITNLLSDRKIDENAHAR